VLVGDSEAVRLKVGNSFQVTGGGVTKLSSLLTHKLFIIFPIFANLHICFLLLVFTDSVRELSSKIDSI